ncbi:MAG: B3/B4 domain-containing protein [Chloroflexia bacterium]
MKTFRVADELFQRFPGLTIGVVVAHALEPPKEPQAITCLLAAAQQHFREAWGGRPPQEHPQIALWRRAFQALGLSGVKYPSSIEALARRALSERGLPSILPLVDLYNAVSLRHVIPMGGHDLQAIERSILLGPTRGGELFRPLFSETVEAVGAGEIAYLDGEDVLTRHWVWRQGHKDRIRPETRAVFIPIDGLPEVGPAVVQAAAEEVAALLVAHFAARVRIACATQKEPEIPLDPG